jgi:hypothetical protein
VVDQTQKGPEIIGLVAKAKKGKKLTLRELEDLGRWWGMRPVDVQRALQYMPREELGVSLMAETSEDNRPKGRIGKAVRLNSLERELGLWQFRSLAEFRGYAWLQLLRSEAKPNSIEDVVVLVDGPNREGVMLGSKIQADFTIKENWSGAGRIPYFFGDSRQDCPEDDMRNTPVAIMAAKGVNARITEIEWSIHDMLLRHRDSSMWHPLDYREGFFLVDETISPEVKSRLKKYNMSQEVSILETATG